MDDGTTWEAQCVLAYLRANASNILSVTYNSEKRINEGRLEVGRFENDLEQGYMFSLIYRSEQRNYVVYNDRSTTGLELFVFDQLTNDTPTKEDIWKAGGKVRPQPTKTFEWNEIIKCATYIQKDMEQWLQTRTKPLTIPEHIDAWEEETQMLSNVTEIVNNKHFLEIVNAKKEAVPYIVERIKEKPSNLMWALNLIYGKKISDKKGLTITEACKLWVDEIENQTKERQDCEEH
jgi:hypothetical protein